MRKGRRAGREGRRGAEWGEGGKKRGRRKLRMDKKKKIVCVFRNGSKEI